MKMNGKLMMIIAATTLAGACGPEQVVDTGVTGVTLTVVSGVAVDQVSIAGEVEGGSPFDEVRTPQPPRPFSNTDETIVILVDEELSGRLLTLTVEGWSGGQLVAGGSTEVELERRQLVSAMVRLDCRGDACEDCGPESCSTGCCAAGGCLAPSVEHCGTAGETCLACDPRWADRCVGGECHCGNEPACEPGQRCASGQCVCDGESCPAGCCEGQQCLLRSFESCGVAGTTCVACEPELANSCSGDGECRCGNGPPCALGQNCLSGLCVCDSISCDGCCEGDICQTPSVESCGSDGATCTPCPEGVADQCSLEGVCQCGEGPMAGPGQRCVDGERICDEHSCAAGCCVGNTCETPTLETCGTDGEACTSCPFERASRCVDGECRCGTAAPCEANQRCVGGECVCNGESCDGCCDGTSCQPGTDPLACGARGNACMACPDGDECLSGICSSCTPTECPSGCCLGSLCVEATNAEACGTAGEACLDCGDHADRCSSGACRCGTRPPCEVGQVCVDGECLCDAISCPHGCCDGDVCPDRPLPRGLRQRGRGLSELLPRAGRRLLTRGGLSLRQRAGLSAGAAMRLGDLRL